MQPASEKHAPASPCNRVCRLDALHGLCIGCLRTPEEIQLWGEADAAERRRVHARISDRRHELLGERARPGGTQDPSRYAHPPEE